jgi:hypothetical protein
MISIAKRQSKAETNLTEPNHDENYIERVSLFDGILLCIYNTL